MTKYIVGDVLEITEDFVLECASYNEGEKYSVVEVDRTLYTLETDEYSYANTISEVDAHSGFRKVEPKVEHMVIGKTYQSTSNGLFYTPTEIDFEAGRVAFDYKGEQDSLVYKAARKFYSIEEEFGVLPPVKPVGVSQVALDELKPENTLDAAITESETVSVDALREAWDYVDHEYPDIEKLIKLAKRLS